MLEAERTSPGTFHDVASAAKQTSRVRMAWCFLMSVHAALQFLSPRRSICSKRTML